MSEKLIHEFEKNSNEVVRISTSEFKGKNLINIRIYYQSDTGEFLPSKKGITINVELFDDLMDGLNKLKNELK